MSKKKKKPQSAQKPIPETYPEFDSDLAEENLENDIPNADLKNI